MRMRNISVIARPISPMQRSYALLRIEAEGELVGYGERLSNYGHSYPAVIKTIVDRIVMPNLVGKDAGEIRRRVAELHVILDGYLGWDGVRAHVICAVEIALCDLLGKSVGLPICRLLGGAPTSLPLYGTGTTMFEATPDWGVAIPNVVRARPGASVSGDQKESR